MEKTNKQKFWGNNGQKFSKFEENYILPHRPRNSMNLKQKKHEENDTKASIIITLLRISYKEKI